MKIAILALLFVSQMSHAVEIFWHRGDVSYAQENSLKAINSALDSKYSNVEIDAVDYKYFGEQSAVLAHDKKAKRITGLKGKISDYNYTELENTANKELAAEPIISFTTFLDGLVQRKNSGEKFQFIIDIKKRWGIGKKFPTYLAQEVMKRDLVEEALFLGWKRSVCKQVRKACKQCKLGIIVKSPLLKRNHPKRKYLMSSKLDKTSIKDDYQFVIFKDVELFKFQDVLPSWKKRGIKVAAYSSNMEQEYTTKQLDILKQLDFVVLDSKQIEQF